MNGSNPTFAKAPIVEAIVDIECDFPPSFDLSLLQEASQGAFFSSYPELQIQHRFAQEIHVSPKTNSLIGQEIRTGIEAFRFLGSEARQIVQVRISGYSFNRLAPYASFDDYLPEIRRTWKLYCEVAAPIQVRLIRLRYINRLPLPIVDGRVELDDYFKVGPRLPDEERLAFIGFLNQHSAIERDTGYLVETVLTATKSNSDFLTIIFDNTASAQVNLDPADWTEIERTLQSLRDLKNRIFTNTLTEKCLSLFH